MNRKIYPLMLGLCVGFILISSIFKLIYPSQFVIIVTNSRLLTIGEYVDKYPILQYLTGMFFGIITYFLYMSACLKQSLTSSKWIIGFIGYYSILHAIMITDMEFGMSVSILSMIIVPIAFKANIWDVGVIFIIHNISQLASLHTRSLLPNTYYSDSLSASILIIECYIWLGLFLVIQIKYKELSLWEHLALRSMEKIQKFCREKLLNAMPKLLSIAELSFSVKKHLRRRKIAKLVRNNQDFQIIRYVNRIQRIEMISVTSCILSVIIVVSIIFSKELEAIMLLIAHHVIRSNIGKEYHSTHNGICMFITWSIFITSIIFINPIAFNILTPILLMYLISCVGYLIVDNQDLKREIQNNKERG